MSILQQDIEYELPEFYNEVGYDIGRWADYLADRTRPDWRGYQSFKYAVVMKSVYPDMPDALIYHEHMMNCQKSAIRIARHIREFLTQETKKLCKQKKDARIKVYDPKLPLTKWD